MPPRRDPRCSRDSAVEAAGALTLRREDPTGLDPAADQAGIALGVLAALPLARGLTSLLHGVAPADPGTFAAVVLVTGAVALAASLGPARRAGRTQPAAVLHDG